MPARQTPTGTILVDVPKRKEAGAVLYARVSSADQRADLDRQVARLAASGTRLIVMEADEGKDDLVQDMIEGLTSFCARHYGRRSARHRAEQAIQAAAEP